MADEATAVALARLEGKVDGILFRLDESAGDQLDHESRLRALESRSVVTPKAMWAGIGTVAAVVGTLGPYLFKLYGG